MIQKNITKFLLLTIAFTFALSINYIFAAWTGPIQAPPGGNAPTPVHIGTTNQVKDGGLGLNALSVFGNGYFQDNVGIGTASLTSPAPNGQTGNLDVNDVYLASIGKWLSQAQAQTVSGGCYVSYSDSCLSSFANKGLIGSWGSCSYGIADNYHAHFRPAGGSCKSGWISNTYGNANVCCQ